MSGMCTVYSTLTSTAPLKDPLKTKEVHFEGPELRNNELEPPTQFKALPTHQRLILPTVDFVSHSPPIGGGAQLYLEKLVTVA